MAAAGRAPRATRSGTGWTLALGLWLATSASTAVAQSVEHGRALYEARCSACHSVDTNRTGPLHQGLPGRRAGSVPGFAYSPALAGSRLVWSRATLLAWLRDPEALIPGQAMDVSVSVDADRQDLVAYLMTLQPSGPR